MAISATTIGLGLIAGVVVALVGNVRAAPVIANIALIAAVDRRRDGARRPPAAKLTADDGAADRRPGTGATAPT